jgi:hypothetical protein
MSVLPFIIIKLKPRASIDKGYTKIIHGLVRPLGEFIDTFKRIKGSIHG